MILIGDETFWGFPQGFELEIPSSLFFSLLGENRIAGSIVVDFFFFFFKPLIELSCLNESYYH